MSRRRISNSREVKAIWLTVGWADGFKLVWEAGDVAGGREGKGGRSGSGGEINPREVKASRGKEEGGGFERPQKSQGQGFHRSGGMWKPWVEGSLVALAVMGCPCPSEESVCVFGSV